MCVSDRERTRELRRDAQNFSQLPAMRKPANEDAVHSSAMVKTFVVLNQASRKQAFGAAEVQLHTILTAADRDEC
jgi:hypothetical protein